LQDRGIVAVIGRAQLQDGLPEDIAGGIGVCGRGLTNFHIDPPPP